MADIFDQLGFRLQKCDEPIEMLHEGNCFGNRANRV